MCPVKKGGRGRSWCTPLLTLAVVLKGADARAECGLQKPMIVRFPRGGYSEESIGLLVGWRVSDVEEEARWINCDFGVDDARVAARGALRRQDRDMNFKGKKASKNLCTPVGGWKY
jgi:hypothetical protein